MRKECCFPLSNGLLTGKTGETIYLFHCSRVWPDNKYDESAGSLIGEIQEAIQMNVSFDYADGLAGIGSSFCYLLREGFIETDSADFFADFDSIFFKKVCFSAHTDLSRVSGLIGIGFYLLNRLKDSPECNCIEAVKLRNLLLLIQDVILARLGMNGYTYPFLTTGKLPEYGMDDIKRFLRKMQTTGLCPELTRKAMTVMNGAGDNEYSIYEQLEIANSNKDEQTKQTLLRKIAASLDESVTKRLASLQLQDMTLPAWWELF